MSEAARAAIGEALDEVRAQMDQGAYDGAAVTMNEQVRTRIQQIQGTMQHSTSGDRI